MLCQLSATLVTCSVRVGAVIVQLLPDVAQPGVDSGNYSLYGETHSEHAQKCTLLVLD